MDKRASASSPSTRRQQAPRRPLIELAKNRWWMETSSGQAATYDKEPGCEAAMRSRRFRRSLLVFSLLLSGCWLGYRWWAAPNWAEQEALNWSVRAGADGKSPHGWYGVNVRPQFADMVQVAVLKAHLLPQTGRHRSKEKQGKRLVVVGDVHGCKDELVKLLDKAAFSPETDHLILTGDMIAKGPDSGGVVDLARKLGASCVRGNHEDRVLLAYRDAHAHHVPSQSTPGWDPDRTGDDDDAAADLGAFPDSVSKDRALAAMLTPKQAEYLSSCPVILRIGPVAGLGGDVVVVHAGLVPGVELERQDPVHVMNMRSIDLGTHVPSQNGSEGTPWSKLWNAFQGHLKTEAERTTVLYGHDSKRGLQLTEHAKGLDTACVRGGKLTAFVVAEGKRKAKTSVVSVKCRDHRGRGRS
ncbi:MAG: hypothetical protein M1832_000697 [Thelocarpon impressellum]|nr:MAG: hypothetical protein M1832_000697 [Thelocarpon impressellum]